MLAELRDLMKCPYDWFDITGHPWEDSILHADWLYALGKMAPENADLPYEDWEWSLLEDDNEFVAYLVGLLGPLHEQTVEFYDTKCSGRLRTLYFMPPGEQGKHFVQGLDEKKTIERTKGKKRPSLFFQNVSGSELRQEFWDWVTHCFGPQWDYYSYFYLMHPEESDEPCDEPRYALWRRLLSHQQVRICMKLNRAIGASRGMRTNHILYDFDFNSGRVHCFPVTEADAVAEMEKVGVADLDEFYRMG